MQNYISRIPNWKFTKIFLNMLLEEFISFLFTVSKLKLSIRCLIAKNRMPPIQTIGTVVAKTMTIVKVISNIA